jgi:uncharacterized protein (TIGR02246 family)
MLVFHIDFWVTMQLGGGVRFSAETSTRRRNALFPPGGSLVYRPPSNGVIGSSLRLDVESTVRGLTQDFCTAFNTGNYDQVAALFASDGVLMFSHRESSPGPKAIERVLREYGESGYQNLRFETTRVDYSGDVAIEIGRYSVSIKIGNTTVADAGKFLRAWRRLGAWRIIGDCWSRQVPVADQNVKLGQDTKVA